MATDEGNGRRNTAGKRDSDYEHAGVAILVHKDLWPHVNDVSPLGGRLGSWLANQPVGQLLSQIMLALAS